MGLGGLAALQNTTLFTSIFSNQIIYFPLFFFISGLLLYSVHLRYPNIALIYFFSYFFRLIGYFLIIFHYYYDLYIIEKSNINSQYIKVIHFILAFLEGYLTVFTTVFLLTFVFFKSSFEISLEIVFTFFFAILLATISYIVDLGLRFCSSFFWSNSSSFFFYICYSLSLLICYGRALFPFDFSLNTIFYCKTSHPNFITKFLEKGISTVTEYLQGLFKNIYTRVVSRL